MTNQQANVASSATDITFVVNGFTYSVTPTVGIPAVIEVTSEGEGDPVVVYNGTPLAASEAAATLPADEAVSETVTQTVSETVVNPASEAVVEETVAETMAEAVVDPAEEVVVQEAVAEETLLEETADEEAVEETVAEAAVVEEVAIEEADTDEAVVTALMVDGSATEPAAEDVAVTSESPVAVDTAATPDATEAANDAEVLVAAESEAAGDDVTTGDDAEDVAEWADRDCFDFADIDTSGEADDVTAADVLAWLQEDGNPLLERIADFFEKAGFDHTNMPAADGASGFADAQHGCHWHSHAEELVG